MARHMSKEKALWVQRHANAALEDHQVLEARRRVSAGELTIQQAADEYGISYGAMRNLISGRTYGWVGYPQKVGHAAGGLPETDFDAMKQRLAGLQQPEREFTPEEQAAIRLGGYKIKESILRKDLEKHLQPEFSSPLELDFGYEPEPEVDPLDKLQQEAAKLKGEES